MGRTNGTRTYVLACDEEGVRDAFHEPTDARLLKALSEPNLGRIFTDRTVGPRILEAMPCAELTVHRSECVDLAWERMGECVTTFRATLPSSASRRLGPVAPTLARPPLRLTMREGAQVAEASRDVPGLPGFLRARDALVAALEGNERARAERELERWRDGNPFLRCFATVTRGIDALAGAVFNAGYGEIPNRHWRAFKALPFDVRPGEPALKPVVRHLWTRNLGRVADLELGPAAMPR